MSELCGCRKHRRTQQGGRVRAGYHASLPLRCGKCRGLNLQGFASKCLLLALCCRLKRLKQVGCYWGHTDRDPNVTTKATCGPVLPTWAMHQVGNYLGTPGSWSAQS